MSAVSEPQRYTYIGDAFYATDTYQSAPNCEYVTYTDAKAWVEREVAAARAAGGYSEAAMNAAFVKGYEQGQRDAPPGLGGCGECG
jgi:hypothetical protein